MRHVEAMHWIKEQTEPEARFIVLTPEVRWHSDETQEWFPTVAKRESILTVQGREWLSGNDFSNTGQARKAVISDFIRNRDLKKVSSYVDYDFTHIAVFGVSLVTNLESDETSGLEMIYSNQAARIYKIVGP